MRAVSELTRHGRREGYHRTPALPTRPGARNGRQALALWGPFAGGGEAGLAAPWDGERL